MKIAIAGVITKPIIPHPKGGTEAFTYSLVKELVEKGHEITLYCAKGSQTPAQNHVAICEADEAMGQESNVEFVYPYTLLEVRRILEDIRKQQFDILHVNFLKTFIVSFFADQIKIPVLHTIHRDFMENPRLFNVYDRIGFHKNEHFGFVSKSAQARSILKKNTHAIYNGIDIFDFPFKEEANQSNYLWLSRVDELKGPKEAALAAKKAGVPLILAGDIDREKYQQYFEQSIKPLLSDMITYEKPSDQARKIHLYQNSKAFLFPIQWEEPFGLVAVEAMSCGTPVIAFNRGAMSEIIQDKITGYLVDKEKGVEGIAEAIQEINSLTKEEYDFMRQRCRKRVEENFSSSRMGEEYEKLYTKLTKI